MNWLNRLLAAALLVGIVQSPLFAEKGDSREELLFSPELSTEISSKVEEKVSEAPGVIKVWTETDIEKLGLYTLSDLAMITPGYGLAADHGLSGFEIRGANISPRTNNNVYLMINGIPINSPEVGRVWFEEEIPVYFAKKVEFLKGPSSALYGSGAFLGVINIVPKDLTGNGSKSSLLLTGGGPDNIRRALSYSAAKNEKIEISISGNIFHKRANRKLYEDIAYYYGITPEPHYSFLQDNVDAGSLYASMKVTEEDSLLSGLEPGIIYLSREAGQREGILGMTNNAEYQGYEMVIPFFKLSRELQQNVTLNTQVHYQIYTPRCFFVYADEHLSDNIYSITPEWGMTGIAVRKVPLFCTDLNIMYDKDNLNVVGGLGYERKNFLGYPDSFGYGTGTTYRIWASTDRDWTISSNTRSGYMQVKYLFPVLRGLHATAGGRYDRTKDVKATISPRVGLVQKITDSLNAKVLYGRAILSPTLLETLWRSDTTISPQKIDTLEGSFVYSTKRFETTLTYFRNEIFDSIISNNLSLFVNDARVRKSSGFEFEVDVLIGPGKVFVNSTLQRSNDEEGGNLANIPRKKFNAGLMMNMPRTKTEVAIVGRFVGDYTNRTGLTDPHILEVRGDKAENVTLLDVNIVQKNIIKTVDLELQVKNVLNKDYSLPSALTEVPYDNNQVGRTILVSLRSTF